MKTKKCYKEYTIVFSSKLIYFLVISENQTWWGQEENERFACFLPPTPRLCRMHDGYFNVFISLFGNDGEQLDLFDDDKDLDKYYGFVISASPHDTFTDADWIFKLAS